MDQDELPADCTLADPTTGPIVCTSSDLPPGGATSFEIPVRGAEAGEQTVSGEAGATTPDPDTTNNVAAISIEVIPVADITVEITADPTLTYVGTDDEGDPSTDGHELTITTRNEGPGTSTVTLTVSVPDEAGPPRNPCLRARGCSLGDMAPDSDVVTTIQLSPEVAYTGTAVVEVTSSVRDLDPSSNSDSVDLEALEPRILLLPPLGTPGSVTFAVGRDFPPDTDLTHAWDRGLNAHERPVRTDENGRFSVPVMVLHRDRLGERDIRAVTDALPFDVRVDFLVVPRTQAPPEFVGRG